MLCIRIWVRLHALAALRGSKLQGRILFHLLPLLLYHIGLYLFPSSMSRVLLVSITSW